VSGGRVQAPIVLYRIATDTPTYTADDLSGTGAKQSGGRWNQPGVAMLYTSTSRALACLETLAHLAGGSSLPLNRYLVEITVPAAVWTARTIFAPASHVGWDALPPGLVSIAWGTTWAQNGSTLLAEVPSVIVEEEPNVLLNPTHPDLPQVTARKVRRWHYDPRL
jgi:RES domain-containing protein